MALTPLLNHPVFAKYPSPEELQQQIDKFRSEHPDEFSLAYVDFDAAVRFLHNQPPPTARDFIAANGKLPHRIHEWLVHPPSSREQVLNHQSERATKTGVTARMQVVRENIDTLTVDFSPALRMAVLDVVLNGWDDWHAWTTDRLKGYHRRYPDIYRISAVSILMGMDHELWQRRRRREPTADLEVDDGLRTQGLFLRMLMGTESSHELQRRVRSQVKRIHNDLDALDFVVKLALEGESRKDRLSNGQYCMGSLTESLPIEQQREFWIPYLDCEDRAIRSYAVSRVGITIDLLKNDPKELKTNHLLAERLRMIAASDPDPQIRLVAKRSLIRYEDKSPRRGLIDYGNGKNGE